MEREIIYGIKWWIGVLRFKDLDKDVSVHLVPLQRAMKEKQEILEN